MTNKMSISYLLNPETSINDLPHEILDKIKNMVLELQLQDHKKKYQHTLNAIPVVAKVLWSYTSYGFDIMPILVPSLHPDLAIIDEDDEMSPETSNFLMDIQTDLEYYNIFGYLTKSTHYHKTLIELLKTYNI